MVYVVGKPLLSLLSHCKEIVDDVLLMFIGANGLFGTETPTQNELKNSAYLSVQWSICGQISELLIYPERNIYNL